MRRRIGTIILVAFVGQQFLYCCSTDDVAETLVGERGHAHGLASCSHHHRHDRGLAEPVGQDPDDLPGHIHVLCVGDHVFYSCVSGVKLLPPCATGWLPPVMCTCPGSSTRWLEQGTACCDDRASLAALPLRAELCVYLL